MKRRARVGGFRSHVPQAKGEKTMAMVVFSASGYETSTHFYENRNKAVEAIESEVHDMAVDHGFDPKKSVSRWTDEWVLKGANEEEIARWELFDK